MMAGVTLQICDKNSKVEIESLPNSHFNDLIQRLNKMAKNTSIDSELSQTLDEFIEKINYCERFLEHGIVTMNFAEAALLLQNSADIYSKKVDLLWDIIFDYQKRIVTSDDHNRDKEQELVNLEERKRKYKRKRQSNETQTQRKKLVNQFSFENAETFDYINQTYETSNITEKWEKISSQEETSNNHTDILNKNFQFLPDNPIHTEDNEYIGRYDQFHSASQIEEIFNLEEQRNFVEKSYTDYAVNCDLDKSSFKKSSVILEKLPTDIVTEHIRRYSCADSMFDDCLSSVSENCDNDQECEGLEVIPYEQIAASVDKRNKSCSQDSAFYDLDESSKSTLFPRSRSASKTPIVPQRPTRNIKRKQFLDELNVNNFKEEVNKKRKKKISAQRIKKLSTGVTTSFREFEKFCRQNYKSEENEGIVPPQLTDSEDSDDDPEDSEEEDVEDTAVDEDINEDEEQNEDNEFTEEATDLPEPSFNSTEILKPIPSLLPEDLEAEEISRNNVKEWRSFIMPVIKKMNSKSDFDIHEYGLNIIEPMKIGEERNFKDIVTGKKAPEVARYFIASLQLANTRNVEIIGGAPGKLANEYFRVKALDKTRHHELLEEYQAPSEETFRERLEKAKAMNPKMALHSTPFQPPAAKRVKIANCSRKKLY